ncbi:hypothetical protein BJV74DRAFT_413426 [Russula compacta]|nr:hypothetical protein BJV74DRAFT_413426 [Russula compacta]
MVYIPFASLLGLQAALEPLVFKQSAPEPVAELASIAAVPFVNPTIGGGSLLDHDSGGLGEPLNVIISGLSSPWVLSDGGFLHFANAIGFGIECFGAHLGAPQTANLGDGHGWVNQTIELRNDYGNADIGSCWESLAGGNHLRLFRQNGPSAPTNALFLAVSEEENVFEGHNIAPDGYDVGRESLVKSALRLKKYKGVKYHVTLENITGLIPPGSNGVNHGIPIDGVVALLTVTISK